MCPQILKKIIINVDFDDIASLVENVFVYRGGGGLTNKLDHHKPGLQPGVTQRDWRSAACCLPEAPRLCLYQQSQSTEQQEAFSSIVSTLLGYMHFKWAQTELTALQPPGNHNIWWW